MILNPKTQLIKRFRAYNPVWDAADYLPFVHSIMLEAERQKPFRLYYVDDEGEEVNMITPGDWD